MAVTDVHGDGNETDEDVAPLVSALHTSPDRTVFTEEGNSDGWIATDFAVEPRQ